MSHFCRNSMYESATQRHGGKYIYLSILFTSRSFSLNILQYVRYLCGTIVHTHTNIDGKRLTCKLFYRMVPLWLDCIQLLYHNGMTKKNIVFSRLVSILNKFMYLEKKKKIIVLIQCRCVRVNVLSFWNGKNCVFRNGKMKGTNVW